jgi:hypothetical protein
MEEGKEHWDDLAFEQRREEGKQTRLRRVWKYVMEECPHLIRNRDSTDTCQFDGVCVLELGQKCETFDHILAEWKVAVRLCVDHPENDSNPRTEAKTEYKQQ